MAIDKALNQAPLGLTEDDLRIAQKIQPDIEIEIEDPESVTIGMDGLEIEIGKKDETDEDFNANLAEYMDDSELQSLTNELISDYEDDISSRKDWIQTYVDGLELLGMKLEDRAEPWEGACGVYHPLLSEALVKFQSETMLATFPAMGPVKTIIIGKETPEKKEAADRVQEDMNYQLMDVMKEYRPEHERMLWGLGLSGNAFKKVYYDPHLERQVSMYVPAEDIVVPYGASDLESAERVTHVMRKTENELTRLQVSGFYRDVELGAPNNMLDEVEKKIAEKLGFRATSDHRYKILEMHVELALPGYEDKDEDGHETGIALPYVVTIEKGSNTVLAIRRNWDPEDDTKRKRQHFVHYGYVPGFGFYYFGLIHLVGAFAKSGTSLIRQLVDAGTLSNLPGGFKARGLRVKGDDTPIAPGEFRDVDVPSGSIRDNLLPLPYKEPSQTLYQLFNTIIEEGRRFANTADLQISDMSAQAPVGTTLAILERTLKTMSAIQARIHYSMKQELGLLKSIIAAYTPEEYDYDPDEGDRKAKKEDYDSVDVIPVSDPNASTMAQKIIQYQAVLQLAQSAPGLYNLPLLHRQMLDVLGIKDAAKLVPMEEDQRPTDPVTETQNLLMMKPVKAFLTQDHKAHLAVHLAAAQDPHLQELVQNNPQAQQIIQAAAAHINEHLGFEYRKQIEIQLGFNLPPQTDENGEDAPMDPEVEARLAPLLAQAAQQLLAQNKGEMAQQQAQQQAQDPIIQIQMQDIAIKKAEQQRKIARDQADIKLKEQELQIEQQRIVTQAQTERERMNAANEKTLMQMKSANTRDQLKMVIDTLTHMSTQSHEKDIHASDLKNSNAQNQLKMIIEALTHLSSQAHQKEMQQNKPIPFKKSPKEEK